MKPNLTSLSRRDFLTTAARAGGAARLAPGWLIATTDEVDPRVSQVLSKTIGVDMHNHPAGTEPIPTLGRRLAPWAALSQAGPPAGGPPQPQQPQNSKPGQELFLAEELKRSGLTAVCASYVLDSRDGGEYGIRHRQIGTQAGPDSLPARRRGTQEMMELLYITSSNSGKKFVHYAAVHDAPWIWYETGDASKVPANGGHGTDMFRVHPELPGIIVDWFVTTLIKTPGHAPADTVASAAIINQIRTSGSP